MYVCKMYANAVEVEYLDSNLPIKILGTFLTVLVTYLRYFLAHLLPIN